MLQMQGGGHTDVLIYFKCPPTQQVQYPVNAYVFYYSAPPLNYIYTLLQLAKNKKTIFFTQKRIAKIASNNTPSKCYYRLSRKSFHKIELKWTRVYF